MYAAVSAACGEICGQSLFEGLYLKRSTVVTYKIVQLDSGDTRVDT